MIKLIADGFNDVNLWKSFGGLFCLVLAGFCWSGLVLTGSIVVVLARFSSFWLISLDMGSHSFIVQIGNSDPDTFI